jgi:hypothetical protein
VFGGRGRHGDIVRKHLDCSLDSGETSDGQKIGLIFNVGQASHRFDARPAERKNLPVALIG